jgi:SagB-type dehydrogenase family enzyme
MTWIDLGNPQPLEPPQPYVFVPWPEGQARPLEGGLGPQGATLAAISGNRHSRRSFAAPEITKIGELLALTSRVSSVVSSTLGFLQTTRPTPSAGAIHPIHLILHSSREHGWCRYDPLEHALIDLPSPVAPTIVRDALNIVLPGQDATLLLFAGEPALTFAKYRDACSLLWRDAGVLQGYLSLAAEALRLNFCLLGVTGEPWISALIEQKALRGVGAAWVGAAP